jgi:hypothetical protein
MFSGELGEIKTVEEAQKIWTSFTLAGDMLWSIINKRISPKDFSHSSLEKPGEETLPAAFPTEWDSLLSEIASRCSNSEAK